MQRLRRTDGWIPDLAMAHPRHAVRHDGRGKEQPLLTNNKLIHALRPLAYTQFRFHLCGAGAGPSVRGGGDRCREAWQKA